MIKRLLIAIVLLAVLAAGVVGFNMFRDQAIENFFANMPVATVTVSTVEVKPESWTPSIDAIGTVNAIRGVDLTVETTGIVKELHFSANQRVEQGEVLDRDVRAAREAEACLKVVMVHENDAERGGCEFSSFFATTPASLISDGLYTDIAIALHTLPHRTISLALVAQALGAIKVDAMAKAKRQLSLSLRKTSHTNVSKNSNLFTPGPW